MSEDKYRIPHEDAVSADDINPVADLIKTDLSEADLINADLKEADLSAADLRQAELQEADLSEANLYRADLSEANLYLTNLSETNLRGADLSEANLRETDLSEANLRGADLSEANLREADLSKANLREADLSESDLVNAILTDVVLWDVTLSETVLSRGTEFDPPKQRINQYAEDPNALSTSRSRYDTIAGATSRRRYDAIARANHELRTAYSENGLIKQARNARVRERKARRNEARVEGGRLSRGTGAYLLSCVSQLFTGYGVQLLPILLVMSALFFGSAIVYTIWGGMPVERSLYYSIVTFTTSPPQNPSEAGFGLFPALVAGVETIAGTTAIIFLGYVLGTRERV
jgi:Uncharacterized low-complexity proteins